MTQANSLTQIQDKRAVINALKMEIEMIRDGRYNPPVGKPREVPRLFRDSITCPNVTLRDDAREIPCEHCFLHRFLPGDHPHRDLACYDIPLNERGDTLAMLEDRGDPEAAQAAVLSWLYKTVAELERAASRRVA